LTRFMKNFFAEGNYLDSLDAYLSLSDSEIFTALRKSAKDPNASGHSDADCLLRREKRFKAITLKERMGENELLELSKDLEIPFDCIFWEISAHKRGQKGLSFPVQMRSGAIVWGSELSQISIPSNNMQWAYVHPQYEQVLRLKLEHSHASAH